MYIFVGALEVALGDVIEELADLTNCVGDREAETLTCVQQNVSEERLNSNDVMIGPKRGNAAIPDCFGLEPFPSSAHGREEARTYFFSVLREICPGLFHEIKRELFPVYLEWAETYSGERLVGAPTLPTGGCTNATITFAGLTLRSADHIAATM